MAVRQTHTYAELELSPLAYREIRAKLEAAGYQHAFMDNGTIDMHGIGVTKAEGEPMRCTRCGWPVDTTAKPVFGNGA